jgi:hypothetical protein
MSVFLSFRSAALCVVILFCWWWGDVLRAQYGRSTGRFNEVGVIDSIAAGKISVTHDDGRKIEYSAGDLMFQPDGKVTVKGELPASFLEPGMVLSTSVSMSPIGKVLQSANRLKFLNDQSTSLQLERTDTVGVYAVVGKVIRTTGGGVLLKVPKSPLARQGRVELPTTSETKILFDMTSFDRVNSGDIVQSMIGVTYANDVKVITSIAIELCPHRKRKTEALSPTDQLLQKYAYLSDENEAEPRVVKLPNFMLMTDMSPLQVKVLGVKLEAMHQVVERYYRRGPRERIVGQVVADDASWQEFATNGVGGYRIDDFAGNAMVMKTNDDHDVVLRSAFHAFCKSTFGHSGPQWYCDGMSLMANFWQMSEKGVTVTPEVIAFLRSNPPQSLGEVIDMDDDNQTASGGSGDVQKWRDKAASWALCYMMIHNANYSKDFRKWGVAVMMGHADTFQLRFGDRMDQIAFEYRQMLSRLEIGYREDLCEWDWKTPAKKLHGSDMVESAVDARSGWQATRVELVEGETYEFVAQGQWQVGPDEDACSADGADGANGEGRLLGAIYEGFQLSQPISMGTRGKFTARGNGQLFLRCADQWNDIEDNKGRLKVFVRKAR